MTLSCDQICAAVISLADEVNPAASPILILALTSKTIGPSAIYDIAVDVRPGSATYGKWVGAELTAERGEQIFVPRGFAHGYVTLTDDCELFYKVDGFSFLMRAETH